MFVKITDDIELRCTAKLDTDQHHHGQIIVFDISEANDYAMLSRFDVRLLLERESDPPVH